MLTLRGRRCTTAKQAMQDAFPKALRGDPNWVARKGLESAEKTLALVQEILEGILRGSKKGWCATFDIDETVLFSKGKTVTPNPMPQQLYQICRGLGIPVYFITARPQEPHNTRWTHEELHKAGYTDYEGVFMRPHEGEFSSSVIKFLARNYLVTRKNHHIILNVGDQFSDLFLNSCDFEKLPKDQYYVLPGVHGEVAVKLPNNQYVIP